MKERLITLALAAGALALFYALFLPKPLPADLAPALPTSVETGDGGYQAAWRWLQQSRIPVVSFRDHYDRLSKFTENPVGNVLIVNLPLKETARDEELASLHSWIDNGNTLLIMAALDDTPRWALVADTGFERFLEDVAGIKVAVVKAGKTDKSPGAVIGAESLGHAVARLLQPEKSLLVPNGTHPLLSGVGSVAAVSEFPASHWTAETIDNSAMLSIGLRKPAAADASTEPALWLKRVGQGQVILSAYATPFTNQLIGENDSARLLSNIIGWSRVAVGRVLFDDAHQGLVSYYDARAFYADPRLHRTLLWILLLWLVFVLGWQRLRAQPDGWHPVDVTTFIRVTGEFIAGSVTGALASQRLIQNFFNAIRRRRLMSENGEPVWDWLGAQAGVSATDVQQLQDLHGKVNSNRKIDLVDLQNLLTRLTRKMA